MVIYLFNSDNSKMSDMYKGYQSCCCELYQRRDFQKYETVIKGNKFQKTTEKEKLYILL